MSPLIGLGVLIGVVIGTLGFVLGQAYPNAAAEARVACALVGAEAVDIDGTWMCLAGHRLRAVPR